MAVRPEGPNDAQILAMALAEETIARRLAEQENMILKAQIANLEKGHVTVLERLPDNASQSGE